MDHHSCGTSPTDLELSSPEDDAGCKNKTSDGEREAVDTDDSLPDNETRD